VETDRFTTKKQARAGWALLLAAVILVTTIPSLADNLSRSQAIVNPPYLDPALKTDQRVDDLYNRLTLQEAFSFLTQTSMPIPRLPFPGCNTGIPGFFAQNEALHGIVSPPATVYPNPTALGATFDPAAIYNMTSQISDEARAYFNEFGGVQAPYWPNGPSYLVYYAPNVNMASDPRWGRTQETYGEDPLLVSDMGVAYVQGMQGTPYLQARNYSAPIKTVTTPKHFVANQEEDWTAANGTHRDRFDLTAVVDQKWLEQYFLQPFQAVIVQGGSESIMSAYNAIERPGVDTTGTGCTGNSWLLNDTLRGSWKFQGYVTSDCGAIGTLINHKNVATGPEAVAMAINAGLDMACGDEPVKYGMAAYDMGLIHPAALERAVKANLRRWFDLGFFNPTNPWQKIDSSVIGDNTHHALALKLAEESIVLLKNENASVNTPFLPLHPATVHSISIAGFGANETRFGDYSGTPVNKSVSPLDGISAWAKKNSISVNYVPFMNDSAAGYPNETAAARSSDVAIVVAGLLTSNQKYNKDLNYEDEGHDRLYYNLDPYQVSLINHTMAVNSKTIVILEGGSAIGVAPWISNPNCTAVLDAWYPGEAGGDAIANILSGAVNPSGRLPETFYKSLDQIPAFDDYDLAHGKTYMYLNSTPEFPFGYGLSYTNFTYSNFALNATTAHDGDTILASLDVKNTGKVVGDDVVQIYVKKIASAYPGSANLQLHGFKRVSIAAGTIAQVSIPIKTNDLTIWDSATNQPVLEKGTYEIMAGESATNILLTMPLTIS